MAGVLQFTLGLATGNFVSNAGKAAGAIKGLVVAAAGFAGLSSATGGIFAAFEKGAGLEHLHKRTGEAVGDLYKIQKGLKAVGLDGEAAGTLIYQLNKSLGGFNELGEPTKDVFAAIGTGVEELKKMQAPEKLLALANALNKLDNETATNISSKIFGRAGAGDFLQMARSAKEFAEAMGGAGPTAEILDRKAVAFAKIERSMEKIKNLGKSLFIGIAEGLQPGLQGVLDIITKLNLLGLGQTIGRFINSFAEGFKQGRLSELITLSLEAGIERAFLFTSSLFGNTSFWQGIGQTALGGFMVLGTGLAKMLKVPFDFAEALQIKIAQQAASLLPGGKPAANFAEIFKDVQGASGFVFDSIVGDSLKNGVGLAGKGGGNLIDALKKAAADSLTGDKSLQLGLLLDDLLRNSHQFNGAPGRDAAALLAGPAKESKSRLARTDTNDLERIGGIFFGRNLNIDYQRQTAGNTHKTNELLGRIVDRIINPAQFANFA